MSEQKIQILEKALLREKLARKEAEKILEERALELYQTNQRLSKVLNEKEVQLENLFKTIVDPYILMDLSGNVLKMNDAAISFYGYNIEHEPFNVVRTLYKDDVVYAMNAFNDLLKQGNFRNFQARVYTKSKALKWVHINSSIVYDVSGNPLFAQGILRDITQEREQQQIFDEQKKQLKTIVDHSSLGIVLTQYGKIIKTNKAFQDFLGYTEEELAQKEVKDLSIKEDYSESRDYMEQLNSGKINEFSIEKKYLTKDQSLVWAKTSVSVVKDLNNQIKYQVAIVEDITDELKNKSLLKALNNLMSSILGKLSMHEIAWEITNNTTKLLGFEDCVIYVKVPHQDRLKQIAAYGDKISQQKIIKNPLEVKIGKGIVGTVAKTGIAEIIPDTSKDERYLVDNKRRYSEISVPIIADGEIIGVLDSEHSSKNFFTEYHLETLTTIAGLAATQLKNALSLQLRLEAEKEKEALLKKLTKSNKELNDFAHVVSHDLKSPLRSMNALVTWLEEDCNEFITPEIEHNFQLLLKKIDKMDHLIDGILQYAGVDKIEQPSQKVNLDQLVKDIVDTIYVPQHIRIDIPEQLPVVNGHQFRLHQLFQNLISNAVKHIDKEKGLVQITYRSNPKNWGFSIADNGIGIAKKYHTKIFDIFQTLHESENSTGVGLSIVKKIIGLYGGKIWLDSTIGKGTTFHFTISK